jgi:hypothetical protein
MLLMADDYSPLIPAKAGIQRRVPAYAGTSGNQRMPWKHQQ